VFLYCLQDNKSLNELAQFYWLFDNPLAFLYKHRPASEPLRTAFLSTSLIYLKQWSSASQWRKESFLQIPPTLEVSDVEAGADINRLKRFLRRIHFWFSCVSFEVLIDLATFY